MRLLQMTMLMLLMLLQMMMLQMMMLLLWMKLASVLDWTIAPVSRRFPSRMRPAPAAACPSPCSCPRSSPCL